MKAVYGFRSYREALNEKINDWKALAPSRTLTALAEVAGMQLSYLSNALKDRAHLSSDQLYAVATELEFEPAEIDYLLLLLEFDRTALKKRRAELERRIREIQNEQLSTQKNLKAETLKLNLQDLETYYLDPFIQLVHLYLAMHPGAANAKLSHEFGLSEAHVARILNFLEKAGLAKRKGTGFSAETPNLHLAKDSPVTTPYLVLMRVKALDQLQRLTPSQRYSFTVTMSTSHETRLKLEREFTKFLQTAEKLVAGTKPEALYQLNFDLFPWQTLSARAREE